MKKMKRILALTMALVMVMALAACGGKDEPAPDTTTPDEPTETTQEITLWTYPIGNWGKEDVVNELMAQFEADTGIKVKVEYLAYADGDDKVNSAISANGAPDLIMEGPERLVANWGAKGYMVDLADLLDDTDKTEINAAALTACTTADGKVYEYPVVMTAHCMAINKNAFEEAGALQYVDLENHTWTTDNFVKAVEALYAHYGQTVGAVFCAGQGGDQGTRALITNLNGGTYANAEHTEYTYASQENAEALARLYAQDGITFDTAIQATEEIQNFVNGTFQMAFCWNISQEVNNADVLGFDVLPMAFPSDTTPSLQGGIWGFGIFNNGDDARIEAAKTFIKFMTEDDAQYTKAVEATSFAPVRDVEGVYATNELFPEYSLLSPMMGDYYQITKGWTPARTEWWNMLQRVSASDGSVDSILAEMQTAQDAANAAAAAE